MKAPSNRSFRKPVRAVALLVALAPSFGCGSEGPAGSPTANGTGVLADLAAESAESIAPSRDTETVTRFTMTNANRRQCPWIVEGPGEIVPTMLQPAGGTEDRSKMIAGTAARGYGAKTFSYPFEFSAGEVTSALAFVTCYGEGVESVRAVAYDANGDAREASAWQPVAARRDPHSLAFDLEMPLTLGEPRAGVRLEFEGLVGHAALMSMVLQRQDIAVRMPTVGSPEILARGESWRTCAGLVEGSQWCCDAALPEPSGEHARIQLSATLPTWSKGNARSTRMFASIARAGEEVAAGSIELGAVSADGWTEIEVDLGEVPAGPAEVRLTIEDDDDASLAHVIVGDAVLIMRSREPRTVLLITSDTHRADHLGLYGARPVVDTPSLKALGQRGVYFTSAFSTTNVTNPSHIAVMTGIHPRDTQIVDNKTRLSERVETLAEVFRARGYRTFAAISTQHLDPLQSGLGQGFGRFDSPPDFKRSGDVAVNRVRDWIVDDAEGQSVFAWIHLFDAHGPYDPPEEQFARYGDNLPKVRDGGFSMPERYVPNWIRKEGIGNEDYVNALYAAEVDYVDRALADLLELGRMREALIAFTADHGESLTEHSIYWDHAGMFLPSLAVPMIIAGPGVDAAETDVPVQQSSVARTLLDLSGIEVEFPGQNLLEDAVASRRIEPLFGLSSHGLQATVTLDDWHLVMDLRDFKADEREFEWEKGRTMLFDRKDGISSEQDVSEANAEVTAEMRAALVRWLGEGSTEGLGRESQVSAEGAENLRVLGYTGFTERTSSSWYTEDPDGGDR